jgi:hypothetical protein
MEMVNYCKLLEQYMIFTEMNICSTFEGISSTEVNKCPFYHTKVAIKPI